jgi:hypothetical protein
MFLQVAPPPPAPAQTAPAAPVPGQTPPSTPAPGETTPATPAAAPAPAIPRVFGGEAGLIFNAVRPDAVMDFEMVLGRLKEALAASADPVRRQQAQGWKIFKATEPGPASSVLYVFVMDPAVKGADYGVAKILAEAFPAEAQELYRLYIGAFSGGQSLLNLQAR